MSNRSTAGTFIKIGYYLAIASVGILLLTFILGYVLEGASNITFWLIFLTSGLGVATGFMARADINQGRYAPEKTEKDRLRVGLRVNVAALVLTFLVFVITMILALSNTGTASL